MKKTNKNKATVNGENNNGNVGDIDQKTHETSFNGNGFFSKVNINETFAETFTETFAETKTFVKT